MITRDDVAKYAGVSKSTVSRVLNNNGYVSPENRIKIEHAIKDLGYTPNLIARSLKTRETRQILFCVSDLSNPFYFEVYKGMEDFAEKHGYTIVVSSHINSQVVKQRQFDGIILSHFSEMYEEELSKLKIPIVVTSYSDIPLSVPSVGIDMEDGAIISMKYLQDMGHTRIAFLANSSDKSDLRYKGFIKGYRKENLDEMPSDLIFTADSNTYYQRGFDTASKLMEKSTGITALLSFNDAMAIGAVSALNAKDIRVPDDISIVGFDNILQSAYTVPPLTTVHIPKYEQGWESAKLLLSAIKGEEVRSMTLKTHLVERNSVAAIVSNKSDNCL